MKKKITIFYQNKSTKDVLLESIMFAVSFMFCAAFCTAIIVLIYNLIKY